MKCFFLVAAKHSSLGYCKSHYDKTYYDKTYYPWKRAYAAHGEKGLINNKSCLENPKLRPPLPIEEKVLYLRRTYPFGQVGISWYLIRYHGIKISSGGVYNVLRRHGLNRLPADSLLHKGIPKSCTIHNNFWVGQDRE